MSEVAPVETPTALDPLALVEMAAEVVSAYVARNSVPPTDLPALIVSVHGSLSSLGKAALVIPTPAKTTPPVPIKKSIADDYLVSLEDGKRYRSLKRHLAKHGLTPAEYRAKWGLPTDYPMVSPAYARKRSELAKGLGLGRKPAQGLARAPVTKAASIDTSSERNAKAA